MTSQRTLVEPLLIDLPTKIHAILHEEESYENFARRVFPARLSCLTYLPYRRPLQKKKNFFSLTTSLFTFLTL